MIIDIVQAIINQSDKLLNQIRCMKINKYVYENTYIYKLCGENSHNSHRIYKITQKVIEQKKYCRLVYLDFDNRNHLGNCNKEVIDINHLADTLEYLNCPWDCGICQTGISKLKKIKTLLCGSNKKIDNVGHIADTLEVLECSGLCGIGQDSISKLKKLRILDFYCNSKITDVNHLADTLTELKCGRSEMHQKGISELKNIKILEFHNNRYIYDANHLKDTLEELYCGPEISDEGISELKNIKIISLENNKKIKNISHMASLEKLVCRHNHMIEKSKSRYVHTRITSTGYYMHSYSDKYKCSHLYSRYGMQYP